MVNVKDLRQSIPTSLLASRFSLGPPHADGNSLVAVKGLTLSLCLREPLKPLCRAALMNV